jgi:hypothetical protein
VIARVLVVCGLAVAVACGGRSSSSGAGDTNGGLTGGDAGDDGAAEAGADAGGKPLGTPCNSGADCASGVCFVGGGGSVSWCSLHCTQSDAQTTCGAAPFDGTCNTQGYCRLPR